MSSPSEADRLVREKAEAEKKAAEDTAAATAAATANWPIGGYDVFVSLLFLCIPITSIAQHRQYKKCREETAYYNISAIHGNLHS